MTPPPSLKIPKNPEMTIRRLSVYTRCLLQLEEDGVKTVSSEELAERFNLNSAQVRKDLAYFGEFGVRGIGYYVAGLKAELLKILGLDREWEAALVGVTIQPMKELPREAKAKNLNIGIIAVPADAAQATAEKLVASGIKAILNFA